MSTPAFAKVPSQVSFPQIEQGIIALWERLDAFHASNRRRKAQGAKEFVFYDGPPFATGTPHYGHLLAGTIKDIVPRYWSMRGYHVERRFGWDCHGLPIEALAQKALGLKGTPDIQRVGVAAFNEQCRSMVLTYVAEWRKTVTRMGRWVDFDNDYKTMDPDFMESVWWVFKQLWDQGLIYKAHRIMWYDPVLTTPLSNNEVGDNYRDVQDPAITIRFALRGAGPLPRADRVYALAWTTTPWTLPENLALCVGPDIRYVFVEDIGSGDIYLLAKERLAAYYKKPEQYRVVSEHAGSELVGLRYEPLFPYFAAEANAFRILADGFVSTGDGTGIVHMAPAYGEDDYRVCRAAGIAIVDPLDAECRFTSALPEYAGQFCKDADKAIIKRLKDEGKLVHQSTIVHAYPYGDRSDSPLISRAMEAWYVRMDGLRPKMVACNQQIRWVPEAIGSNRFGNLIANGPDWNISRNRFWGSCIPVWVNVADPADMICVGSVAELERLSGVKVADLHKHIVDQVEIVRDGKRYRRTPEVLDCWFESGAMPYGQQHYPFADKAKFEADFPAQFIAEGLDQTRGWFNSLLVLSTALFGKPAFRNVIVNGLILAEAYYKGPEYVPHEHAEERQGRVFDRRDGTELRIAAEKMSKSKKNYPDPGKILDEIGADALRAYLIDSPVVRAEPLRFSENGLREIVRTVVLPFWNALSFFTTYASVDGWSPAKPARPVAQRAEMDRWVLSTMQSLVRDVNREMEGYRLYTVVPRLVAFIDDLTNWYIRRSRPRFWKSKDPVDQADAYATLYEVLVTFAKVLAPFMPFLTEEVYQRLVVAIDAAAPKSVHWCDYPHERTELIDRALEERIAVARGIVVLGRKLREDHKLKTRQPLAKLTVVSRDAAVRAAAEACAALIADELNVKAVATSADEASFCAISVKPNFKELGKRAGPKLKEIGAALAGWSHAEVARLEGGGSVEVAGVALGLNDVLLQRTPVAGSFVASAGAISAVIDTALTPGLVREGLAEEFTSILQQGRKAAGLEVSDRIAVAWDSPDDEVQAALIEHGPAIAEEVLAVRFAREPGLAGTSADLNGRPVVWKLAKA